MTTLFIMRAVGIRELKAQLSSVLREVQRGETILVTDRGRVVAEIRTPVEQQLGDSPVDRALARMAARGEVRLARRPKMPLPKLPGGPPVPPGTAMEMINLDRGD